jgi:hypothetical protein
VQGYNAQVVASPEQVIVAAQVTQSHNDADQLEPMVAQAADALREAGIEEPIGIVLADGGYWNSPAIGEVREQNIDVLIPTRDRRRTRPRKLAPRQGKEARRIEAVLSTPEGQALYRRRQQIVEPVFAHTKCIRRTDRFLRRGLASCQAEWQLIAATHNLLKLWRAGLAQAATVIPEPQAGSRDRRRLRQLHPNPFDPCTSGTAIETPAPRLCATASQRGFVRQPRLRAFRESPLTDSNRRPPRLLPRVEVPLEGRRRGCRRAHV